VLEGVGRMRVNGDTLTVPKHGGVLVGPDALRQVFNDMDAETLWLIVGAQLSAMANMLGWGAPNLKTIPANIFSLRIP